MIDKDRDCKSCYVRCDCGNEILGFHAYKQDDCYHFFLRYYGHLHNTKDFYCSMEWIKPEEVRCFVKDLINWVKGVDQKLHITFKKEFKHLNNSDIIDIFKNKNVEVEDYKENNIPLLILENWKDTLISITKYKSVKELKCKKDKCTWNIVLGKREAKKFAEAIDHILRECEEEEKENVQSL